MPVHLFGQMADMTVLTEIAQKHGLALIGDAAQAIGCAHHGKEVGEWSALTTLSFYPTKNLGAAGDGGMILTSDDDLNTKLRSIRFHGTSGPYRYRYVGVCSRLDGVQAAVLNVKLPHLPEWNEKRRQNAAYYMEHLADVDGICLPVCRPENVHTYHQFTVRVLGGKRDALRSFLAEREVSSGIFYPYPLHLEEAYLRYGGKSGDFPEAERACVEVLSLPVIPELTPEQRAYVVESVRAFFAVPEGRRGITSGLSLPADERGTNSAAVGTRSSSSRCVETHCSGRGAQDKRYCRSIWSVRRRAAGRCTRSTRR
jgi:dTDP-4-amino-4,6-dideoxygalactose transaminase